MKAIGSCRFKSSKVGRFLHFFFEEAAPKLSYTGTSEMVKASAGQALLKRLDNERAMKGTLSVTSMFQKVRICTRSHAFFFL